MNQVFYITEEEKREILARRLEMERKANRKEMSATEIYHILIGILMAAVSILALYLSATIDGEFIIFTFLCGFMSLVCFCTKKEMEN